MKIVILIPAFNEERSIQKTIQSVLPYGHVIVVDDCSTDATVSVAKKSGATVLSQTKNGGYDATLEAGFQFLLKSDYTHVITFDADGQHPSQLVPLYKENLERFDLVLGVRPEYARFAEGVFAFYTKLRYGVSDPLCGMKGYNLDLVKRFKKFDTYGSTGTELMLRALRCKSSFIQIQIPIEPRVGSSRFGSILRGNWRIFKSLGRSIARGL